MRKFLLGFLLLTFVFVLGACQIENDEAAYEYCMNALDKANYPVPDSSTQPK